MDGAIHRVGSGEMAYAKRSTRWLVSIDGFWSDPARDREAIAWVRHAWAELSELGTGTPYLNFTGIVGEDQSSGVKSAFGRNLERLAEIKARYDPDNLFRLNNNIAPATGSKAGAP